MGKPFSRVDGQVKVRGAAKFSAEYKVKNLVYAALRYSTIAKRKIISIVRTHTAIDPLKKIPFSSKHLLESYRAAAAG